MSSGKLAAQIGHCAELYWLHLLDNSLNYQILRDTYESWDLDIDKETVEQYMRGAITKTVLQARNLNHLLKAKTLAEELGLKEGYDFGFVRDKCLTELTPENEDGTCTTCFWTKPLPDEIAWKISKKYHLYTDEKKSQ
jgi:peptidyl-tRNA hydrolase